MWFWEGMRWQRQTKGVFKISLQIFSGEGHGFHQCERPRRTKIHPIMLRGWKLKRSLGGSVDSLALLHIIRVISGVSLKRGDIFHRLFHKSGRNLLFLALSTPFGYDVTARERNSACGYLPFSRCISTCQYDKHQSNEGLSEYLGVGRMLAVRERWRLSSHRMPMEKAFET